MASSVTFSTAILMRQNAFLLAWNSCVRVAGRMNRYFLWRDWFEMKAKSELIEKSSKDSFLVKVFLYRAVRYPDCYQFPVLALILSVILLRICRYQTYTVGQIILHLLGD